MISTYVSNVSIDNVVNSFSHGIEQTEDSLNSLISSIQSEANPSQQDLILLQSVTAKWQVMVQTASAFQKSIGDTMKAVVMNIGS